MGIMEWLAFGSLLFMFLGGSNQDIFRHFQTRGES